MTLSLDRNPVDNDWIDASYGEPIVVKQALQDVLNKYGFKLDDSNLLFNQYGPASGSRELVELISSKYQGAKVVITAGGKHGLNAVMYALKKTGNNSITIHSPYWSNTPDIIKNAGLNVEILNKGDDMTSPAFMVTSPNNPDGFELAQETLEQMFSLAKESGVKLIHDASYNTPIYTANFDSVRNIAHCQIYTYSKMYGLSGLRVGYLLTYDDDVYRYASEYVDNVSTCVSMSAQNIVLQVEKFLASKPEALIEFEANARNALIEARGELMSVRADTLEVNTCNSNSMFAVCKVMDRFDADRAKIKVTDGAAFGKPGYIRINLAIGAEHVQEIVRRLNK